VTEGRELAFRCCGAHFLGKIITGADFFAGYSPEAASNPGDKEHTVTNVLKVTSGSHRSGEYVDQLYKSVITAGHTKASSIKVAEAGPK